MKKTMITLSVLAAVVAPGQVIADKKVGENLDTETKVESSPAMDALSLSASLEAIGREKKDALLLAAALRLQQSVAVDSESRDKTV